MADPPRQHRAVPRAGSSSRRRKRRLRAVSQSVAEAQAAGDPVAARCCEAELEQPPARERGRARAVGGALAQCSSNDGTRRSPRSRRRMSEEPKLEELDRLISMGKQKGFLTYDEVNDALPSDIVSLDQLDDIMMMFGAMDIEVVDSAKAGRLPSEVRARRAAASDDDDDGRRSRSTSRPARSAAPRIPSASTCARWAAWPSSPARARSRWPSASRRARTRSPAPSSPPTSPSSDSASCATQLRRERHLRQGSGRRQRGGVHRGEGGGAHAASVIARASATSTGCCASATSSSSRRASCAASARAARRKAQGQGAGRGRSSSSRPSSARRRCSRSCAR